MKKILFNCSIATALFLTGCGGPSSPNMPSNNDTLKHKNLALNDSGEMTITNIEGSKTMFKAAYKLKGKHQAVAKVVAPAMKRVKEEVKNRGYRYFQIVSPQMISNLEGFPINTVEDLTNFLNPATSMPRYSLNALETGKTLMDNQESQNVVNIPFTIFGETELTIIVRLVEESTYDEIVWDAERS